MRAFSRPKALDEFLLAGVQRIQPEFRKRSVVCLLARNLHAAESADVRVAKPRPLSSEKKMCVCGELGVSGEEDRSVGRSYPDESKSSGAADRRNQIEDDKFSVPPHRSDSFAGQCSADPAGSSIKSVLLKRIRVIRLPGSAACNPRTTVSTSGSSGMS